MRAVVGFRETRRPGFQRFAMTALAANLILPVCAGILPSGGKEYRTTTAAAYEIAIRKDGAANVLLSNGDPVFLNAYPMVWIEGEEVPARLSAPGKYSSREGVRDRLGEGQGVLFDTSSFRWSHRIYPAERFFTVQLAYRNMTKKPMRVKALFPWATGQGRDGGVYLGPGTHNANILQGGKQFPGDVTAPSLTTAPATSYWNLAMYNSGTGRSLIAGAVTHNAAYTRFRIDAARDAPESFRVFEAECVYDPPVELAPGKELVSEVVYFGVAHANPFDGLERFAQSLARANDLRPRRAFLPHGWDSWSTEYGSDINEAKILENLRSVDEHLKRYGWKHFAIDDGWQIANGDWEPNPERFPRGMKAIADDIHARGMTAGLWVAPFRVHVNSRLAREHPEWLRPPNALGRQVVGEDDRILDVTAPGAYKFVRDLAAKIGIEWGFDALMEADFVYYLPLAESYYDSSLTRVEIHRKGMQALREGFGDRRFIMSFAPQPVTAMFADGMRLGEDCAPVWRRVPGRWPAGCVETLTTAARKYYFSPHVWAPDQDCAFFDHAATRRRWGVADQPALTRDQSIAWLTGAALTGGVVKIGDRFSTLSADEISILQKLLPVLPQSARPVDLFDNPHPQIWVLPVSAPIGSWTLAAVFNWDETQPARVPLSLDKLGLNGRHTYAAYDFWEEKYYGVVEGQVVVVVPPAAVRLLCLRRYTGTPMLLSTDRHFSQGATDFTLLEWDEAARELRGAFDAVENTDYSLRVLAPEPHAPKGVEVSCGPANVAVEGPVLRFTFHCAAPGSVNWKVRF